MRPKPDFEFEKVYLLNIQDNGPRSGVANYHGRPHAFKSLYAEVAGWQSNLFLLRPIEEETLSLALEDWEIWEHQHGRLPGILDQLFPERKRRHEEIRAILNERLRIDPKDAIHVEGNFRYINNTYEVCWKFIR